MVYSGVPYRHILDHPAVERKFLMYTRCDMCNEIDLDVLGPVELRYLALFEPLMLHHDCWAKLVRVESKLKRVRR